MRIQIIRYNIKAHHTLALSHNRPTFFNFTIMFLFHVALGQPLSPEVTGALSFHSATLDSPVAIYDREGRVDVTETFPCQFLPQNGIKRGSAFF
jgi:hypothetical protein